MKNLQHQNRDFYQKNNVLFFEKPSEISDQTLDIEAQKTQTKKEFSGLKSEVFTEKETETQQREKSETEKILRKLLATPGNSSTKKIIKTMKKEGWESVGGMHFREQVVQFRQNIAQYPKGSLKIGYGVIKTSIPANGLGFGTQAARMDIYKQARKNGKTTKVDTSNYPSVKIQRKLEDGQKEYLIILSGTADGSSPKPSKDSPQGETSKKSVKDFLNPIKNIFNPVIDAFKPKEYAKTRTEQPEILEKNNGTQDEGKTHLETE